MISYAIGRFDYYSNMRHKYLTLGLSLIGVGSALTGLSTKLLGEINLASSIIGVLGFISLFISGIIMVFIYNRYTTADYPYRKIMNIQSWYFKYKLGEKSSLVLSEVYSNAFGQIEYITNDYLNGVYNWLDKTQQKNYFIKEDLEQVAILHLLQKYGSDCVKKMKKTLMWGLIIFVTLFTIAFLGEILWEYISWLKK